jgi:hypothetical protein
MRLLPQLLTQPAVPNIAAGLARLPPEWWPASCRNGGPLHVGTVAHFSVGMVARFASVYPARFRRNSQPVQSIGGCALPLTIFRRLHALLVASDHPPNAGTVRNVHYIMQ